MKILVLSTFDFYGGAAKAAYRIHSAILGNGIESKMLVKYKSTDNDQIISIYDIKRSQLKSRMFGFVENKVKNKIQQFQWRKYIVNEGAYISDLRSISLIDIIKEYDCDVIHLHWVNLRYLNLKELVKLNKPIVWTLHDSWAFTGICHIPNDCRGYINSCGCCPILNSTEPEDISHKTWVKKEQIYRQLNIHVVTPSDWLKTCVLESKLLGGRYVTTIPNCLDIDIFKPGATAILIDSTFINKTTKKILFGAINSTTDLNKGFYKLVEAIKLIEQSNKNTLYELVVFGADKNIEGLNTNIPINYIGFLSTDEDLAALYNHVDVMVVPSLSEVFGQTASEAMSCGTPVVAFNCTGIKEVVDHKVTGYLAEPYSSEDLANGIIWCLENNKDGILSKNARKRVVENYSSEIVVGKYVELYKSVLELP